MMHDNDIVYIIYTLLHIICAYSNKARRKLAKEQEAKQREDEYNLLAMKRSIEGAQFAVSQSIIDPNDLNWQNALDIIIPR